MAPSSRGPDPSVARDVTAFGDFPDRPQYPDSSVTDVTALLCCPPPPDLRSTMTTVRLHTPRLAAAVLGAAVLAGGAAAPASLLRIRLKR